MTNDQREIRRKKRVIEYAENIGNVRKACRYYGVARSSFTGGETDNLNSATRGS